MLMEEDVGNSKIALLLPLNLLQQPAIVMGSPTTPYTTLAMFPLSYPRNP